MLDFDTLCNKIISHIEQDIPGKIDKDTLLLDESIIDSFSMLGIIVLLEELLSIEVQPDDLSSEYFASVAVTAEWGLGIAKT